MESSVPPMPWGFIQEILAVAESSLSILVDRYDDCLDVVVAPAFTWRHKADFG
jgi:hypothetical protein